MRKLCIVLLVFIFSIPAFAEGTRTWEQSKFDEFEKGTAKGVAISSEGWLELAPSFKPLATTPSSYLWAITADSSGNAYLAAGAPARIYRVTPEGQLSVIFEPKELQVQALVVARDGTLFAATSPDGKVYKIVRNAPPAETTADKKSKQKGNESSKKSAKKESTAELSVDSAYTASVYFDPKTKYIWDLALNDSGQLYIATGDHGEIFRVDRSGEGSTFFKSDEAHIRALAFDKQDNLIAGSDGSGLVYRISPAGEAFVLYSAPKKEITALAVDDAGSIYAAGAGEKRIAPAPAPTAAPPPPTTTPTPATTPQGAVATPPPSATPVPTPPSGGSEIYRIASDGSPSRLWGSREDLIYALSFEGSAAKGGQLLAATGNKGRIFAIRSNGEFTDLLKASATQVTGFAPTDKGIFISTSNLGKVFLLAKEPESEGVYESDVFDARNFARWGRAEVRGRGNFSFFARSGNVDNPDRNWSPWVAADRTSDHPLEVPAARFVQWKVVLKPGEPKARIDSVTLNYRPKNITPEVDEVTVQMGSRYPAPVRASGSDRNGAVNPGGSSPSPKSYESTPSPTRDRNSIGVRWSAQDDNDDDLLYSLFYRGDGESEWRPLTKEKLSEKYFSFDADLLPDGGYTVKVVASDAPSNTPEDALSAEKESARFEVDTTPPRVEDLSAATDGDQVHVTFRASDSFSPVRRAEYSLDAGDWQFVEPVGQLSDSKNENYDFAIALGGGNLVKLAMPEADNPKKSKKKKTSRKPPEKSAEAVSEEHVIVVRVYDRFDNVSSAKAVTRR
jgi:sugar lactone lactonase YvrE